MATSSWVLLLVTAASAAFVAVTGEDLPPVVASHFGAGGQANGFMPRGGYVTFMVAMILGMAGLFGGLPLLLRVLPPALFNLPNRDYWLAPERRQATLAHIGRQARGFGCVLLAFLAYVHYLVVQANAVQPAMLPERAFFIGMACFVAASLAWAVALLVRYRRKPA